MSGVTYASKDSSRDVQFVCHLPEGSKHAAEAQQLAGSIFSRKAGKSDRRLTQGQNSAPAMLEDSAAQRRRAAENESSQHRGIGRSRRHGDEELVVLGEEDEYIPTSNARHGSVRHNDDDHARNLRHQDTDSDTASSAVNTATSAHRHAGTGQSGTQGWHHKTDSHTTYNMKTSTRQLFVSAPTGSHEAEIHDRLAAMAAKKGSGAEVSKGLPGLSSCSTMKQ
jgi:hypothetical protein